jgi:hypothetical protein
MFSSSENIRFYEEQQKSIEYSRVKMRPLLQAYTPAPLSVNNWHEVPLFYEEQNNYIESLSAFCYSSFMSQICPELRLVERCGFNNLVPDLNLSKQRVSFGVKKRTRKLSTFVVCRIPSAYTSLRIRIFIQT